jgi:hypothetical protein
MRRKSIVEAAMIPIILLTDKDKRNWLEACNAALSPSEFLVETRLRLLNERVRQTNSVDAGMIAYIDEDGDIAYKITDPLKQYEYYKSSGFPARPGITPEALAAHIAASALRAKKDRQTLRSSADILKPFLLPKYPKLADVPLDIIPEGHVNAWAQPVPAGGDAIGINEQFTRGWVWCEWVIWKWVESPNSPFSVGLDIHDEQMQSWQKAHAPMVRGTEELACSMMGVGCNPRVLVEQYAQDLDRNGRNSRGDLYAKMMAIIAILHEYGHVALGHTDWVRELIEDIVRGKPLRIDKLQLRARQRSNEYAADEFAARALIALGIGGTQEGLKFRNHALGWSAYMLFTLFYFAETFGTSDDDPDVTHPAPMRRIDAFLKKMGIDKLGPYYPAS